ncbi:uncharacterized protein [Physcomitrium patens]|nr:cold shock protein 1-like [Physcomitrium patens]PNR38154.1 hypothetical protein PHYPA_021265 [Physcomitrium patens]|eukprot:XP_024398153.1 cold shock protein 1-like [Physcomitrella patens]
MANKRQRLAKKRLVANGTIAIGEVTSSSGGASNAEKETKDSTDNGGEKKVGNVKGSKRERANDSGGSSGVPKKTKVASSSKHPLRQAGMKPGEGCFLCKSKDHIAKHCPTKSEKDRHKMCLGCRMWGHTLKNCPSEFKSADVKLCYNCGQPGHSLDKCPNPLKDGGSAFAECFLCKQRGHLSKNCPDNKNGIYPKGGSCKICEQVTHLAKDCPQKNSGKFAGNARVKLKISTDSTQISSGVGGKRTVFKSGDDLEDDFQDEGNAGPDTSERSDDDVDDKLGEPISLPKTAKSNTRDISKMLSSGKHKAGKYHPKVVKF